jgi:hypothetical protein
MSEPKVGDRVAEGKRWLRHSRSTVRRNKPARLLTPDIPLGPHFIYRRALTHITP